MLHNEPKVIKLRPWDSVHTFIHLWNHKSTSKYEKTDTQTRIKRASVCQRQGGNSHAQFSRSVHMLTYSQARVHTVHAHMNTHTLFNALGTSHASHFVLCRPRSKETNRSSGPTLKDNFCELIISCIWPITHICGQQWGRDGDGDGDKREDWRALIPASCGRCYCSGASQMSTTWLILCWLTHSFLPTNPQMCSTNNSSSSSSRGSQAVSSRRLTSVWQNREQWMSQGWFWVFGLDYIQRNISAE